MGKKFDEFVNKMDAEAKAKHKGFDPGKRIKKFQMLIEELYSEMNTWLQEGLQNGKIQTGLIPVSIKEELLGIYEVNDKWFQIGNARINLHPVGTILIGTDARIDLTYRSKEIMIVRAGKDIEYPGQIISNQVNGEKVPKKKDKETLVWKYVKDNRRLSYVELNKDSFENLIMDLINGTC